MTHRFARLATFSGMLWLCSIAAALYIACGPLAENLWAYYTWTPTPCYGTSTRYFFDYNGVKYYCSRRDFWNPVSDPAVAIGGSRSENNGTCYIKAGDPPMAVLALDAHRHLEEGIGRFATAALLLGACAIITTMARQRAAPPRSPLP